MPFDTTEFLVRDAGHKLAYRRTLADKDRAGIVWLGGFKSDMAGGKATALHAAMSDAGRSFLRFDYFGHGESDGDFEDGLVSLWRADALAAIDALTDGPQILVGSSMGGWMALLAALARPDTVKGLVLIAPAADFTEKLMWAGFDIATRQEILQTGRWMRPSEFGPYPISRALIEDGRDWNVTDKPLALPMPVRILQGARDEDVPWRYALDLVETIDGEDVVFTLIKDGDHRLSRDEDIERLIATVADVADQADASAS